MNNTLQVQDWKIEVDENQPLLIFEQTTVQDKYDAAQTVILYLYPQILRKLVFSLIWESYFAIAAGSHLVQGCILPTLPGGQEIVFTSIYSQYKYTMRLTDDEVCRLVGMIKDQKWYPKKGE